MRQRAAVVAAAAGAGAVIEYLADPDRGRSRRARVRDKAVRAGHKLRVGAGVLAGDLTNRGHGVVAGTRYRMTGNHVDDPRVLHERARSELGRHVRHPHAVAVHVDEGVVTLTGDVLAREEARALRGLRRVPGVRRVDARWTVHERATGVSALQGEGRQREPIPELLQENWSPTARLLTTLAAVSGWVAAGRLAPAGSWPLRAAAAVLAARAATNLPVRRLTGVKAGRRAIDVEDAITVAARPDEVWERVSDYSVFRLIMPDVREVRRSADGRRSHWVITGPAGLPVSFDAEETGREDGREISWRSCDGQLVAHAGTLRLDPVDGDRTRLQVRLTYNPIAGAVGHAVAAMFRADPKHKLHDDLQRVKSFLETGTPPHDADVADAVRK
jgi:uncharacterized membrane protein